MPDTPPVPGEASSPDEVIAGLRAANARLGELLDQRDAHVASSGMLAQMWMAANMGTPPMRSRRAPNTVQSTWM